jgi:hypothetical protein
MPTLLANSTKRAEDEARLRRHFAWLWPPEIAALKEAEMKPGDVIAYDSALSFMSEAWTFDLRNRLEFVDHTGSDEDYWSRLRALRPRWVSVGEGSKAQALLHQKPEVFEFLFAVPMTGARMYRVRSRDWWLQRNLNPARSGFRQPG